MSNNTNATDGDVLSRLDVDGLEWDECQKTLLAAIAEFAAVLDSSSRYVTELQTTITAADSLDSLVKELTASSRGSRWAGADVFSSMTLGDKLRCNLITNETTLFRFTNGELGCIRKVMLPYIEQRQGRVLVAPCSTGEEAFSIAAECLSLGYTDVKICGMDIQPLCVEVAKTGRLTYAFPLEYMKTVGQVGPDVLAMIDFVVGDILNDSLGEPYNMILCRNFLGYFTVELVEATIRKLTEHLLPGGYLVLDHFVVDKHDTMGDILASCNLLRVNESDPVFFLDGGSQTGDE